MSERSQPDYSRAVARTILDSLGVGQAEQAEERYRSAYERQRDELASNLEFLESVVELLQRRLQPVMADQPQRTADAGLSSGAASPVVAALTDAQRRVALCAHNVQDLIERLEI